MLFDVKDAIAALSKRQTLGKSPRLSQLTRYTDTSFWYLEDHLIVFIGTGLQSVLAEILIKCP